MSMLGEVFGSLGSMGQLQLLLAFVACAGYAFAQGNLLPARGKRFAWGVTTIAVIGFEIECPDWTLGAMLLGFAVAGLGTFVALVWVTSQALGLGREPAESALDESPLDSTFPSLSEPRPRGPQPTGPAHFV
jgi:hypothetical protein